MLTFIFLFIGVPADDVTLTIFRGAKPEKMLEELKEYVEVDQGSGIYRIKDGN